MVNYLIIQSRKKKLSAENFFYDLCPNCYKEFISSVEKLKQEKEQKNNG